MRSSITVSVRASLFAVLVTLSPCHPVTLSARADAFDHYHNPALARLAGNYGQRPVAPAPAANATTIQAALVTPLSGVWKFTYPPPYTYASVEGPQCGSMSVKGGIQLFDVSVSIDGGSVSTYNPDINLGAGVRVHPGLYEFNDFSLEVLSPTRMTTTYDTNPLMACTSVITIEAEWLRSES